MYNNNKIIVGMGEALWDVLPEGKKLGGAPANFAYHVSQFGLNSRVVSAVGEDKLGTEILDNFRQKHMMRTEFLDLRYSAFDIDRAFRDHRRFHDFRFFPCQMHPFKLIHCPSRTHTAEINRLYKLFRRQIDHKFSRLLNHMIRVTLRTHGYICHRRVGTHRSRPCNSKNIAVSVFISHADHNSRDRVQHIPRFPCLFCHKFLILL